MSALGVCIKKLRESAGLSLQEVGDRASVSKAHVWEIETGSVANPTIKTLCCLAVALDVEPDQLAAAAITDCMNSLRVETRSTKFVLPDIVT